MGFEKEVDLKEWHKISNKLTGYFGICRCQRKFKSIIDKTDNKDTKSWAYHNLGNSLLQSQKLDESIEAGAAVHMGTKIGRIITF